MASGSKRKWAAPNVKRSRSWRPFSGSCGSELPLGVGDWNAINRRLRNCAHAGVFELMFNDLSDPGHRDTDGQDPLSRFALKRRKGRAWQRDVPRGDPDIGAHRCLRQICAVRFRDREPLRYRCRRAIDPRPFIRHAAGGHGLRRQMDRLRTDTSHRIAAEGYVLQPPHAPQRVAEAPKDKVWPHQAPCLIENKGPQFKENENSEADQAQCALHRLQGVGFCFYFVMLCPGATANTTAACSESRLGHRI